MDKTSANLALRINIFAFQHEQYVSCKNHFSFVNCVSQAINSFDLLICYLSKIDQKKGRFYVFAIKITEVSNTSVTCTGMLIHISMKKLYTQKTYTIVQCSFKF